MSPRTTVVQKFKSRVLSTTKDVGEKWFVFARNIGLDICSFIRSSCSRNSAEPRKKVISRSRLVALIRCSIHIFPIMVTIILAYFNLSGYFLGGTVNGDAEITQGGTLLMLQIAAKIMELCIIASLTTIVTSIIRDQALSAEGIPFGLFGAGLRVSQLSYLWSPAYIYSGAGIKPLVKRTLILAVIALSILISLFVGPASALLLIPSFQDKWNAGAVDFWLIGTPDTLWPDNLESRHVGGEACLNPDPDIVATAPLNMSSCIWHGYTQLAEGLKDRRFDWQSNVTINDGVVKRQLSRHQSGTTSLETWVLGVHLAAARLSRLLADEWYTAVKWSTAATSPGSFANYQKATEGRGEASIRAWLPAVRTACNRFGTVTDVPGSQTAEDNNITIPFPVLPEYEPIPWDVRGEFNFSTNLNLTVKIPNGTHISTQWLHRPAEVETSSKWASNVYLAVIVPFENYTYDDSPIISPAIMACTIDARWAFGEIIGDGLPLSDNMVQHGQISHQRRMIEVTDHWNNPADFLPTQSRFWRTVTMDLDWLNALTPVLSTNQTGWTTLAASFTNAGLDNSTGLVDGSYVTIGSTVETEIASLVVDGMSRMGLAENGGNMKFVSDRYKWFNLPRNAEDKNDLLLDLLRGRAVMDIPDAAEGMDISELTRLRWTCTIAGYAYNAGSVPYYLALMVLFLHAVFALSQVYTLVYTRRSSSAWETLEEMLILCQASMPQAKKLENTCAGIRSPYTMRQCVRIEAIARMDEEHEELQLRLLGAGQGESGPQAAEIRDNQKYGAATIQKVNGDTQPEVVEQHEDTLPLCDLELGPPIAADEHAGTSSSCESTTAGNQMT